MVTNLRHRGVTRLEVLVLLLLLGVIAAQGIGAAQRSWELSNRVKCAQNLRIIGQAMRAYAIDDVRAGAYPRTLYNTRAAAEPKFGTPYEGTELGPRAGVDPFFTEPKPSREEELLKYTPGPNDITASFYHLMRVSDLKPDHFICPATRRRPLSFGEDVGEGAKRMYTNWPGHAAVRDHLTYSFQNMYFSVEAVGMGARWTDSLSSTYVVAGDINPGGDELVKLQMADTPGVDASGPKGYNSPNHFGYGQNVLHADGAVRFITTPFEGPKRDNIYTFRAADMREAGDRMLGELPSGGIFGSARDGVDNILLPTAELLKQEAGKFATEQEAQRALEEDSWRREILRQYER